MKSTRKASRATSWISVASSEPVMGIPLVEIMGNGRVLIENHAGIAGYADHCVSVNSRMGVIRISGKCLLISYITKHRVIVTGKVYSVTLPGGKDDEK